MSRKENTLHQAHRIAEDHGLFFVPVQEGMVGGWRRAWVLYRKNPHGVRHIRICRCSTPGTLLSQVKKAAGVAGTEPAPQDEPAL